MNPTDARELASSAIERTKEKAKTRDQTNGLSVSDITFEIDRDKKNYYIRFHDESPPITGNDPLIYKILNSYLSTTNQLQFGLGQVRRSADIGSLIHD